MKRKISKREKEYKKRMEFIYENTYKCKCGHSVTIMPPLKKKLCDWCKHYVFRDKKEEFTEKLKKMIKSENMKGDDTIT